MYRRIRQVRCLARVLPRAVSRIAMGRVVLWVLGATLVLVSAVAAHASPPAGDHLTVTVRHAGRGADGTYDLYCHPSGGSHPDAGGACQVVDRNTRWGAEPFAPVPPMTVCTLQYGGPATAQVTGTWAGRPVDASFDRGDGCEIARWDRFVPLLPDSPGPRGRPAAPTADSGNVSSQLLHGSVVTSSCDLPLIRRRERNRCL